MIEVLEAAVAFQQLTLAHLRFIASVPGNLRDLAIDVHGALMGSAD
jgi:hypothetical protein